MTKLKNKLWILFVGAAIFSAVFLFAGFTGGEPVSAEEACTHEYGEGIVHAPTCTAEGYTEYICTLCGESYNLRRGDGCTAAHQRSVGVGRLKLKLAGVGAEK